MSGDKTVSVRRNEIALHGGSLRVLSDDRPPILIGSEKILIGRADTCDLVLKDPAVSSLHAELVATRDGIALRDSGSTNGTYVSSTQVLAAVLREREILRFGNTKVEFTPGVPTTVVVPTRAEFHGLVGNDQSMRQLIAKLERIAPTEVSVLILGETGTGKEVIASALHAASRRAQKPLEVVDCGAIKDSLAEAHLFGHVKGSFTGAIADRMSPFIKANGGTVFLDEFGELPLEIQPKLLRALAERRVLPVGGSKYQDFDVRIIAATRQDLRKRVNNESFRSDLYFRVAQFTVDVPPLRKRLEDIPLLVARITEECGKPGDFERLTDASIERLMRHDWPGNVRELKNAISVALQMAPDGDGSIDAAEYMSPLTSSQEVVPEVGSFQAAEKAYFVRLAQRHPGNISAMAREAGLKRDTIVANLRKYGVPPS